ncbi:MAG: adenosylmethionine decarboxylase [Flavobacteriales bacterium]
MKELSSMVSATETYAPGLHILCDARSAEPELLHTCTGIRAHWEQLIAELGLHSVGSVWHNFTGGGFTGVICLTESHISIHTWPEHGYFTFDIFLSNYRQVNDGKAEELYLSTLSFLQAEAEQTNRVKR